MIVIDVYNEVKLRSLGKFKLNFDKTKINVPSNLDDIVDKELEILVELTMVNNRNEEGEEPLLNSLDIQDLDKVLSRLYILTGTTYLHTSRIRVCSAEGKTYTFTTNNSTYSFNLIQEKLSEPHIKTYYKGDGKLIEVIDYN